MNVHAHSGPTPHSPEWDEEEDDRDPDPLEGEEEIDLTDLFEQPEDAEPVN